MRALRLVAGLTAVIVAFLGGYALSSWRFNTRVLPALLDSYNLHDADFSAHVASNLDGGDTTKAREKLLLKAAVDSKSVPLGPTPFQWKGIFTAPFEDVDAVLRILRDADEGTRRDLSQRMSELCANSQDTKAVRYACNR
jgi:hypothetical protein